MTRRAPRRPTGRRSKLTPELSEQITALVEAGNYIETAAQTLGVSRSTLYQWVQQGEDARRSLADGQKLPDQAHVYADFADRLTRARARAEVSAIDVVQRVMQGGYLIEETPLITRDGQLVRDDAGEIMYSRKFAQPDGKLALEYIARSSPDRWGRQPTQRLEVSAVGAGGGSSLDSEDVAVSLAARLAKVTAERRLEIEAAPEDVVVDAEIVEGT